MSTTRFRKIQRATAGLAAFLAPIAGLVTHTPQAGAIAPVAVQRQSGGDRYETARLTAELAYPGGATEAILARGDLFPDALAASYLAGVLAAPILLTPSASLSPQALQGLDNMNVETVHLIGSATAISESVRTSLVAEGFEVDRISGPNRYATAAAVAENPGSDAVGELAPHGRTAILASGTAFPDALAGGPLSAAEQFPTLLTPPSALAPETADALTELEIAHVLLLGGPLAVGGEVEAAVEASGITVERISGGDRFETANKIADFERDTLAWPVTSLLLAKGNDFPDAVAAGPLGGAKQSPVVLTAAPLPAPSVLTCADNEPTVTTLYVEGGQGAVADATVNQCKAAAEGEEPLPAETLAGYVWANDATPTEPYNADPGYSFNSTGGTNSIARTATGRYTVTFPGLANSGGTMHVAGYGDGSRQCNIVEWVAVDADIHASVACFNGFGADVDTEFVASFVAPAAGTGPMGFVWANDADNAAYAPNPQYSYNSTGSANSITRTGAGAYAVKLPGLAGENGTVQVTAYGSSNHHCQVAGWTPSGADEVVNVRCFTAGAAPVDGQFTMTYVRDGNTLGTTAATGYAWANDADGPVYNPPAAYSFDSEGGAIQVTRDAPGDYVVKFENINSEGGHVQVTPYGAASRTCTIVSWDPVGTDDTEITIKCHDGPISTDSRFTVSIIG